MSFFRYGVSSFIASVIQQFFCRIFTGSYRSSYKYTTAILFYTNFNTFSAVFTATIIQSKDSVAVTSATESFYICLPRLLKGVLMVYHYFLPFASFCCQAQIFFIVSSIGTVATQPRTSLAFLGSAQIFSISPARREPIL